MSCWRTTMLCWHLPLTTSTRASLIINCFVGRAIYSDHRLSMCRPCTVCGVSWTSRRFDKSCGSWHCVAARSSRRTLTRWPTSTAASSAPSLTNSCHFGHPHAKVVCLILGLTTTVATPSVSVDVLKGRLAGPVGSPSCVPIAISSATNVKHSGSHLLPSSSPDWGKCGSLSTGYSAVVDHKEVMTSAPEISTVSSTRKYPTSAHQHPTSQRWVLHPLTVRSLAFSRHTRWRRRSCAFPVKQTVRLRLNPDVAAQGMFGWTNSIPVRHTQCVSVGWRRPAAFK